MKAVFCLLSIVALLTGCVSSSGPDRARTWKTTSKTDQFTDVTTKTVEMNVGGGAYNYSKMTFFVGARTNSVFVGVKSLSNFPVGTVQLRVDENPAVTISPAETPVLFSPSIPLSTNQAMASVQSETMMNMTQIMSPFTATGGDKAQQIIKELVRGKTLRFRTIGVNSAASSTGWAALDESFLSGLKSLGIDPANY